MGLRQLFSIFFRKPPCAASAGLVYYVPVRLRGGPRSLRTDGAKSADPKEDPPRRGSAGRDAEHEIVDARAGSGREAGAKRDERFFSESLILAQNERW